MKSYLYVVLATLCWSFSGIFIKLIANSIPFMTLVCYRAIFMFLFLLIVCSVIDRKTFKINKSDLKNYVLIGFLMALSLILFTSAMYFAPVQNVILITYMYPFFVLIFAYFILKEKITKTKISTLLIAITGLVILNPLQSDSMIGNLLALGNAIIWALCMTLMRHEDINHGIGDTMWFGLFTLIFVIPMPFIFGFGTLSGNFVYLPALGIISSGLAILLFNRGLEKLDAEITAIMALISEPLFAIIWAAIILLEPLNLRVILGGTIVILSGIYLQMHSRKLKIS